MKPKPVSLEAARDGVRRRGRCATPSASSTSALPHVLVTRAVAVLGHRDAGAGDHEGRGGRDVEGRRAVAAGAAGVDDGRRRRASTALGERAHAAASAGDLLGASRPSSAGRSGTPRSGPASPSPRHDHVERLRGASSRPRSSPVQQPARSRCDRIVARATLRPSSASQEVRSSALPARSGSTRGGTGRLDGVARGGAAPITTPSEVQALTSDGRAGSRGRRPASGSGSRSNGRRRPAKTAGAVVVDLRGLAVHRLRPRTTRPPKAGRWPGGRGRRRGSAPRRPNRADRRDARAGVVGRAGPGETTRCVGSSRRDLVDGRSRRCGARSPRRPSSPRYWNRL